MDMKSLESGERIERICPARSSRGKKLGTRDGEGGQGTAGSRELGQAACREGKPKEASRQYYHEIMDNAE
jgi:hypothetical protein